MKNPLALPLAILMASLALLVTAILMTPPIEVVEDHAFDIIVTVPATPRQAPRGGDDAAPPASPEDSAAAEELDPFVASMLAEEAARTTDQ